MNKKLGRPNTITENKNIINQVETMWKSYIDMQTISEKLNISKTSVYNIIKKHNINHIIPKGFKKLQYFNDLYMNNEGKLYKYNWGFYTRNFPTCNGYINYYSPNKKGEYKVIYTHREVYKLFKGEIPEDMVVDHIDGDRTNNHIDNLQLLTWGENVKKGIADAQKKSNWKKIINKRLNDNEKKDIIKMHLNGISYNNIAKKFEVSRTTVEKWIYRYRRNEFQIT